MNLEIDQKSIQEFQDKLKTVEKKAPDRIIDKLDDEGKTFVKAAKENTPRGKTNKLYKGWRHEPVEKVRGGYEKGIRNKAPHHHLVNNGHRRVTPGGRVVGWTNGLFYKEKTIGQEEEPMMNRLQSWLDELFKELK